MGGGGSRATAASAARARATTVPQVSSPAAVTPSPTLAAALAVAPAPAAPADSVSTPRRIETTRLLSSVVEVTALMQNGVPQTPATREQKAIYGFYCPLCFCHFSDGFVTTCCGNNVCQICFSEYISGFNLFLDSEQGRIVEKQRDHQSSSSVTRQAACPHCCQEDTFGIKNVNPAEALKVYSVTPAPKHAAVSVGQNSSSDGGGGHFTFPSPVRVGESFDDLRRKLRPFQGQVGDGPPADPRIEYSCAVSLMRQVLDAALSKHANMNT